MVEKLQSIVDKYINVGMGFLDAFIVFIIGWYLVKLLMYLYYKMMKKSNIDSIIVNFIASILKISLRLILFITVLTTMGVPTTSLIAVLTTAGAAIALGLQDSLKGLVSGITILFAKPFVKGDTIEYNNYIGKIQEIQLLYTILMTADNKMVVIPNTDLATSTFVNYSHEDIRRVDFTLDVHYDSDIETVKAIVKDVINQHPYALKEPLPYVRVSEYKESAIEITIRVWTKTEQYYELKDDLMEQIKVMFDQKGIELPYNQLDVHIHQDMQNDNEV